MMGAAGRDVAAAPLIRVAIVEDDTRTRDGLAFLIDNAPGFRCTGRFRSAEDALRRLARDAPEVVLLDIQLPGMSGADAVALLREQSPMTDILMLTVYADQDNVFRSICNGATGYLLKNTTPAKLLASIREAHDGGAPMSPEIARKVLALFRRARPHAESECALTPHELRLLGLLAQGHSYKAAGDDMGISVNTIRNYVRSVYEKLHVHSKSEAVTKALRHGLIA
jgi:DNA-binding NarL/FixJ family response regulator